MVKLRGMAKGWVGYKASEKVTSKKECIELYDEVNKCVQPTTPWWLCWWARERKNLHITQWKQHLQRVTLITNI